jgi:hypothetical protein
VRVPTTIISSTSLACGASCACATAALIASGKGSIKLSRLGKANLRVKFFDLVDACVCDSIDLGIVTLRSFRKTFTKKQKQKQKQNLFPSKNKRNRINKYDITNNFLYYYIKNNVKINNNNKGLTKK